MLKDTSELRPYPTVKPFPSWDVRSAAYEVEVYRSGLKAIKAYGRAILPPATEDASQIHIPISDSSTS